MDENFIRSLNFFALSNLLNERDVKYLSRELRERMISETDSARKAMLLNDLLNAIKGSYVWMDTRFVKKSEVARRD